MEEKENLFDDILEDDEYVVRIIKPSKRRYWKSLLFFAIPLFWAHFIVIMVLTLFTLPYFYARGYKNTYYAYTNKRLIVRKGMIGVDYHSLDYKDIAATTVNVGILDKKGNTGSVFFKSPSSSIAFNYVEEPYALMKEIKQYMNGLDQEQAIGVKSEVASE